MTKEEIGTPWFTKEAAQKKRIKKAGWGLNLQPAKTGIPRYSNGPDKQSPLGRTPIVRYCAYSVHKWILREPPPLWHWQ